MVSFQGTYDPETVEIFVDGAPISRYDGFVASFRFEPVVDLRSILNTTVVVQLAVCPTEVEHDHGVPHVHTVLPNGRLGPARPIAGGS